MYDKLLKPRQSFLNNPVYPQTVYGVQPPRSPDLIRLDFFYPWGYLKTIVYSDPIGNVEKLYRCTSDACQTTGNPVGIFQSVRQSMTGSFPRLH